MNEHERCCLLRNCVEIKKLPDDHELLVPVKPNYVFLSPASSYQVRKILNERERERSGNLFPEYLRLERDERIDRLAVKTISGEQLPASQVAEINQREMEKVIRSKWSKGVFELIKEAGIEEIPTHLNDGRVRIAVPGCGEGRGINGLLCLFKAWGIPVDIVGIDPRKVGKIEEFKHFLSGTVSTLTFVQMDARAVSDKQKFDMIFFPNPGPFGDWENFLLWKGIEEAMMKTQPALIVFSLYNLNKLVQDPLIIKRTDELSGRIPQLRFGECEKWVFGSVLTSGGYELIAEEINSETKIPYNLYGAAEIVEERIVFTKKIDPYMAIYKRKEI